MFIPVWIKSVHFNSNVITLNRIIGEKIIKTPTTWGLRKPCIRLYLIWHDIKVCKGCCFQYWTILNKKQFNTKHEISLSSERKSRSFENRIVLWFMTPHLYEWLKLNEGKRRLISFSNSLCPCEASTNVFLHARSCRLLLYVVGVRHERICVLMYSWPCA